MSDGNSTTTPRLSGISSPDSPRTSLEQTPTMGSSIQFPPKLTFNPELVFDEPKPRRSSPESDAVASSDEEQDHNRLSFFPPNQLGAVSQLSSRRPSYAAEFHTRQRTYSITGGGPVSPTSSHPNTPGGDTVAWTAGISANPNVGTPAGSSLGPFWGGGSIWNSEPSRKSPPKQLSMPPSATGNSNPSPLFAGSEALPSPTSLPAHNSDFPIPIPLQPQFRNYRSMSFSVGQMDVEDQTRSRLSPPASRQPPQSGLQHRPSRPSLLSEEQFAGSSSPLRSVFETEDGEDLGPKDLVHPQTSGSYFQGQMANHSRAKYEAMRLRNRSASAATIPTLNINPFSGLSMGPKDGERIDEYESALAEDEDMDLTQFQAEQRRFSEVPRAMSMMYSPAENQRLDNLRRQHWASAGGGLGMADPGTQSRRHSFAGGLPTDAPETEFGHGNSEFLSKRNVGTGDNFGLVHRGNNYLSLTDMSNFDNSRKEPLYLEEGRLRPRQSFQAPSKAPPLGPSPTTPPNQLHLQQMQSYAISGRNSPPSSAHRSMLGISMQSRSQQLLYFVTFKACRGDVFYVQEGTGLRVRVGDLVIVEADRGTDLGTVIADNISWQRAKELKEHYAKEQYNVLMMYASRRTTAPGAPALPSAGSQNGSNGGATTGFTNGNSTGAMPTHGQPQNQEGPAELKPKMIKRLAQPHEIQTLRDKEANEAKAKRVCQQKVLEHRLPMEILDAEFQMDWKKLTFYYFADSYINFNSLVTDLFKVYKTRIWMSAMNPASFAHPAGLHPPGSGIPPSSGIGPAGEPSNESLQSQYTSLGQSYPGYSNSAVTIAQRQTSNNQQTSVTGFSSRHSPSVGLQEYNGLVQSNGYSSAYTNGVSGITPQQQALFGNGDGHGPNHPPDVWVGLQGLSLNSH
ncbi:hypothetical protein EDC01DRAFT_612933 [Geopyxis carbonaria]|nr:hypothetical protein EDC01DRAFT_612933 [Geopyxis carbonaria]